MFSFIHNKIFNKNLWLREVPFLGAITVRRHCCELLAQSPGLLPHRSVSRLLGTSELTCKKDPRPVGLEVGWSGPRKGQACQRLQGRSHTTCYAHCCPSRYTHPLCVRFSAKETGMEMKPYELSDLLCFPHPMKTITMLPSERPECK